ncbi:MAG: peptidyl-tRNA hydrolase, family [Chloroflexota bacterium]|nr:peptidyl-tRNA hydrolase, family [Chloroflexota bacterium]
MKLVVGLGNPGKQYEQTRHNVGWMVLDRIADRAGWSGRGKDRDGAVVVRGRHGDLDLVLAKPTMYMNLSGLAVRKLLARERVPLSDVLVVSDDFDLPLGKLRMRESGSAGTHNGLRSIVAELETQKFARLRVGIGEPSQDAKDHVLSRFGEAERGDLDRILDAAADAVEDWAKVGPARASNRWNGWTLPASPDAAELKGTGQTGAEPGGTEGDGARSGPDAEGIVRTKTGWRKLLPPTRETTR